mmetsp:Transcript_33258/g.84971  ORF Transcript_33258/g.84971 Transcript_33258/m.84971 type:complete len:263 (+) Transcript_33258:1769-2557(+)
MPRHADLAPAGRRGVAEVQDAGVVQQVTGLTLAAKDDHLAAVDRAGRVPGARQRRAGDGHLVPHLDFRADVEQVQVVQGALGAAASKEDHPGVAQPPQGVAPPSLRLTLHVQHLPGRLGAAEVQDVGVVERLPAEAFAAKDDKLVANSAGGEVGPRVDCAADLEPPPVECLERHNLLCDVGPAQPPAGCVQHLGGVLPPLVGGGISPDAVAAAELVEPAVDKGQLCKGPGVQQRHQLEEQLGAKHEDSGAMAADLCHWKVDL